MPFCSLTTVLLLIKAPPLILTLLEFWNIVVIQRRITNQRQWFRCLAVLMTFVTERSTRCPLADQTLPNDITTHTHFFEQQFRTETRTGILNLIGRNRKDESGGGRKKKSSFNIVLEAFYYRENVSYYLTFYGVTQEEPPVCRCSYTLVITVYKSSLITFRRLTKAIKVNNNLSPPFKYLFHFRPSD